MSSNEIRFEDGAAYERYMGVWSQRVGAMFLDWLAPRPGLRWLDVGCGNGAFTEMIVARAAPAAVCGIDPSTAQVDFARKRPALQAVAFDVADAQSLPHPAGALDVAVMPLVIFFVPDPAIGVAEMARVLRPGGVAAAYAWDMEGGGFPYEPVLAEMRAMGMNVPSPPSPEASRVDVMQRLWTQAGFEAVETRAFTVERRYAGFDDFWTTLQGGPNVSRQLRQVSAADVARLADRVRVRLVPDADGGITCRARANAVKGRKRG